VSQPQQQLLKILQQTKDILLLPTNDFGWSHWCDASEAVREVEGFISAIENKQAFDELKLRVLFAPTGSIQEVSISSGWGDAFLNLASDFDDALAAFKLEASGSAKY